jgi:hypothetical protein
MNPSSSFVALFLLLSPLSASAQSSDGSGASLGSGVTTVDAGIALSDAQADVEEEAPPEVPDDGLNPRELPDTDYFFAGASFRTLFVPDFIQSLFVTYEGGTAVNFGGGAFFGWRRNGFNVMAEVWYAGFGHQGFYRGSDDPDFEFEYVNSQLGVVFGSFLFGWTIPVADWFGIDIGFGLGIGGMTGNLTRTEAYRTGGAGSSLAACTDVGDPNPIYCEGPLERPNPSTGRLDDSRIMGGTYQNITGPNPFYFGDGGVPPMFLWLDLPRLGVTIRPIRQVQIQINGGYNLFGFNVGATLGYGFGG